MMNRIEIQKFFLLENNSQLFETALLPPSCGGGAIFEQLALYGDQVINIHLYTYLINKGKERKGDITPCKETIHKEPVIAAFAQSLGIKDLLIPLNSIPPNENDLAETVEALLGATLEVNGLERCNPIVSQFVMFAIKRQSELRKMGEFDESQNYKGMLFELFQNPHINISAAQLNASDLDPPCIGGTANSPIFQFTDEKLFVFTFNGKEYKITTNPWQKKILAEQEAAFRALCAINGNNAEYKKFDPTRDNIPALQEKTVHPKTSIENDELIFSKSAPQNKSIEVNQNTGELLIDYVNRKSKKNPFGMLILLSARLNTVSGASWTCEFSSSALALINLELEKQNYFTIGFGPSKTKARNAAGEDMLMKVNLINWLEKHYPNVTI